MRNCTYRIAWSAGSGSYVATCPEFPGLSGTGKTAEIALRELNGLLATTIETYLEEGWPLPGRQRQA